MCLLVFGVEGCGGKRFVVAANRDEFLDRPTKSLNYLDEKKRVAGGRDLTAGGTWLAVSKGKQFGALTNYRDPSRQKNGAPSRGDIILQYLESGLSAQEYLKRLRLTAQMYNGFNLILHDDSGCFYYSNVSDRIQMLGPGLYGLSNHFLNTPWPKVIRAKELLQPQIMDKEIVVAESVFASLRDQWRPLDAQLPDTGIGLEWERQLSSIFITAPNYGTRSSTVVVMGGNKPTYISEMTYTHDGDGGLSSDSRALYL